MSSQGATLTVGADAPQRSFFARIDPRWYSSSLLTLILVIGQWQFEILGDSYVPWAVSLGTAVLAEIVLGWFLRGSVPNLLSAYISGNSVAILLKPAGELLWPFIVGALISIASKYVLNYQKRHLWNPTNFGVCAMLVLASERVSMLSHQWGNDLRFVAIIWGIGVMTVWRAKVWHLTFTYLAAFVAFAGLRALVMPDARFATEVAPITGPMYQLFMFFMITDPKTVVKGRGLQVLIVIGVALLECVIRMACDLELLSGSNALCVAPPMYALFLVGPPALYWQLRRQKPRAGTP